jgi:hypothetical protein
VNKGVAGTGWAGWAGWAGCAGGVGCAGGTAIGPTGGGIRAGGGTGWAGCWGGVVHAASRATTASKGGTLRRVDNMGDRMWILALEAGGALCLLVFIVWWTMYSGRKPDDDNSKR